jgi:uncharacterized protein
MDNGDMPAPNLPTASVDLSDAEFQELDDLLAATPEPLLPMDAVMLDGYLCGVLVQPALIAPEQWLPWVFDAEGRAWPESADRAAHERARALTLRRYSALNRALLDDGWFDPLILEPSDDEAESESAVEATGEGDAASVEDDPLAGMNPVSRPVMPWVAGFQTACSLFPALLEMTDTAVESALARLFRHLPAETDEERELVATLDRELPLATLDDAMEELVVAVADLADLTHDARYRVEPVRRDAPKVGRNDPCPCGSGKKFKQCHGAS